MLPAPPRTDTHNKPLPCFCIPATFLRSCIYVVSRFFSSFPGFQSPFLMDVASPPRYHRYSSRPGPAPQSVDELPPYTRRNTIAQPVVRREPTEHLYLLTEKNRPWVTLKLYSSAKSSKSLPTFFEKENINGSLEINADKGDSIQSITATVRAS